MTNGSLFATKTRFPALTAINVGIKPAAPTIADIIESVSLCWAISQIDCAPLKTLI